MNFNIEQKLMHANIKIKDGFDNLGHIDPKMKSPQSGSIFLGGQVYLDYKP